MKTMIMIGIALVIGYAANAQGWVSAGGSNDGFSFNPYTMSKIPTNSDGINTSPILLKKVPFHIWPEDYDLNNPPASYKVPFIPNNIDGFTPGPNSYIIVREDEVNYDAIPKMRQASVTVQQHKPY